MRASDDGRYIAVGGWNNGVLLADATTQKVLWRERPPPAISITQVCFSGDGQTLYAADESGPCVYILETKTGQPLGELYFSDTGEPGGKRRVACLTASADGAWLAAGTDTDARICLFRANSLKHKPTIIQVSARPNVIRALQFSPDSTYLASVTWDNIRIWKVPEVGGRKPDSRPASAPATEPASRGVSSRE
jgi:WD40 repeat protein